MTEHSEIIANLVAELIQHHLSFPEKIFHYTNIEGLNGFLSNKTLWLTNHKFLNDNQELEYFYKLFDEVVSKREYKFLEQVTTQDINTTDFYVFSCTEDENSLYHWNGYGKYNNAYCLILDSKMIQEKITSQFPGIFITKVIYDLKKQYQIVEKMIEDIEKAFLSFKPEGHLTYNHFKMTIKFSFELIAFLFKDPFFAKEKEVRLFISEHFYKSSTKNHTNPNSPQKKVRTGNTTFKPYYELKCDNFLNDILKGVGIGPHIDQMTSKSGLISFLEINKIDPNIIKVYPSSYREI